MKIGDIVIGRCKKTPEGDCAGIVVDIDCQYVQLSTGYSGNKTRRSINSYDWEVVYKSLEFKIGDNYEIETPYGVLSGKVTHQTIESITIDGNNNVSKRDITNVVKRPNLSVGTFYDITMKDGDKHQGVLRSVKGKYVCCDGYSLPLSEISSAIWREPVPLKVGGCYCVTRKSGSVCGTCLAITDRYAIIQQDNSIEVPVLLSNVINIVPWYPATTICAGTFIKGQRYMVKYADGRWYHGTATVVADTYVTIGFFVLNYAHILEVK